MEVAGCQVSHPVWLLLLTYNWKRQNDLGSESSQTLRICITCDIEEWKQTASLQNLMKPILHRSKTFKGKQSRLLKYGHKQFSLRSVIMCDSPHVISIKLKGAETGKASWFPFILPTWKMKLHVETPTTLTTKYTDLIKWVFFPELRFL